jgi:hypothetical protein
MLYIGQRHKYHLNTEVLLDGRKEVGLAVNTEKIKG